MVSREMEDDLSVSLRAMRETLERFSKLIGTELEKARAESWDAKEIREWEKLQLEVLKLWEKTIADKEDGSRVRPKPHWIKRNRARTPQESNMD